jgi:hypothetical protein
VLAATRRSTVCDRGAAAGERGQRRRRRQGRRYPPPPSPSRRAATYWAAAAVAAAAAAAAQVEMTASAVSAAQSVGTAAVVPPPAARVVAAAAGAASPRRRSMFYVPTQGSSTASTGPCPRTRRLWRGWGQRLRLPPGAGARGQRRVCVPLRGVGGGGGARPARTPSGRILGVSTRGRLWRRRLWWRQSRGQRRQCRRRRRGRWARRRGCGVFVSGAVSHLDGARAQGSPFTAAGPCPDPEAGAWAGAAAPAPSTTGFRRARPAADLSAAPGRWRCGEGGQSVRPARTCDRLLLFLSVGTRVHVR